MCKKLIYVISLMLILSLASNAFAVDWNDGGGDGLWSNGANWVGGVAPDWSTHNIIDGVYTVSCNVADGGGNPMQVKGGATVNVPSGGYFRCRGAHNIGRTAAGATVNVEVGGHYALTGSHCIMGNDAGSWGTVNVNGGKFDGGHVRVGYMGTGTLNYDSTDAGLGLRKIEIPSNIKASTGTLNMNGGLITHQTGDAISIGVYAGSTGTLNLNGGLIDYTSLVIGTAGSATINCNGGTLQIDGDITAALDAAVLAGQLGSTNGGIPVYSYDGVAGVTTLTSIDGMNPVPGAYELSAGVSAFTFTIPDPNDGSSTVTCDVVIGTDSTEVAGVLQVAGDNVQTIAAPGTVAITTAVGNRYYWQIKVNDPSLGGGGYYTPIVFFDVVNFPPIAVVHDDFIDSYIPDDGVTDYIDVQLDGTGSYDQDSPATGPITYTWTITENNSDPANPAYFVDSGTATSTFAMPEIRIPNYDIDGEGTMDDCKGSPGYQVQLVVNDTVGDSVNVAQTEIHMHCSPCNWARYAEDSTYVRPAGDIYDTRQVPDGIQEYIRGDCSVDLYDLAEISKNYLTNQNPISDL